EPGVVLTASGGHSLVVQCGGTALDYADTANGCSDSYTVALTRPPIGTGANAETVTIQVLAPPGLVFLDSGNNPIRTTSDEVDVVRVINADVGSLTSLVGTPSVLTQEAVKGGQSVAAGLNLCFQSATATGANDCISDEIQKVKIAGATGGTFTLTFGANTTAPIAYNASASTVRSALGALPSLGGIANVRVTKAVSTYTH